MSIYLQMVGLTRAPAPTVKRKSAVKERDDTRERKADVLAFLSSGAKSTEQIQQRYGIKQDTAYHFMMRMRDAGTVKNHYRKIGIGNQRVCMWELPI